MTANQQTADEKNGWYAVCAEVAKEQGMHLDNIGLRRLTELVESNASDDGKSPNRPYVEECLLAFLRTTQHTSCFLYR